ncbi:hypothetical protein ACSBR2_042527 [Camellia fascicularis]
MEDFIIDSLKKNLGCRFTSLPSSLSPGIENPRFGSVFIKYGSFSLGNLETLLAKYVHLILKERVRKSLSATQVLQNYVKNWISIVVPFQNK